jgi:type II secretory pathway pseudopilin PulG
MEEIETSPEFDPNANQPSTMQWIIIGIIGLVAVCGVLLFISGTGLTIYSLGRQEQEQAKATSQAAETAAEATAVAAATAAEAREQTLAEASQWPIIVMDTFDDNQNGWIDGEIDDDYAAIQVTIDGDYKWDAYAKQGFAWRVWPEMDFTDDFYLAVDAQNAGDNVNAQYGLIFRNRDDAYFYWEIIDTQNFRFFAYDGDWNELIGSTYTEAIRPGEMNHLVVISENDEYNFWINNQFVGQASGSFPANGQAGVAIGLSYEGEESIILFDNFELRALSTVE